MRGGGGEGRTGRQSEAGASLAERCGKGAPQDPPKMYRGIPRRTPREIHRRIRRALSCRFLWAVLACAPYIGAPENTENFRRYFLDVWAVGR